MKIPSDQSRAFTIARIIWILFTISHSYGENLKDKVLNSFHWTLVLCLLDQKGMEHNTLDPRIRLQELDRRYFHVMELVRASSGSEFYFLDEELSLKSELEESYDPIHACRQKLRIRWMLHILKRRWDCENLAQASILGISLAILVLDLDISILNTDSLALLRKRLRIPYHLLLSLKAYLSSSPENEDTNALRAHQMMPMDS